MRRATRQINGLERDVGEAARRQRNRSRTLKGWETRRGSERLSTVIDADEEWLDESIPASDLPSDDLLHALHDHASRFCSSHSLMLARDHRLQPIRGPSAPSVVRYTPTPAPAGSSIARSRRRGSTMMSIGHVSDKGDEEVAEGEENGEAERSVRPRGSQPGVARGPYVKRDMYSALDGTALVALGILVEEHVKRQLDAMGYQRREDVQRSAGSEDELAVDEGDANDSGDND
ncbi:hypothetical protein EHS25_002057 [Saitozyma podzolica]|uniref:Uncharacterized protein n=1 Tax=Saitozyma podzolica TaxID=1890683 RepID=A0A427YEV2_9TREE|nr:hypothetical protein EHS25_002057 [Saitozyma podzolica]